MRLRKGRAPERRPHPNPAVEVRLQQILSLRRAAERNEAVLDEHHARVRKVSDACARYPNNDGHGRRLAEISRLNTEIARLNTETAALHEQVGALCSVIADDDLLWLEPQRSLERR